MVTCYLQWAWDRESSQAKDRRSTAVPCNQLCTHCTYNRTGTHTHTPQGDRHSVCDSEAIPTGPSSLSHVHLHWPDCTAPWTWPTHPSGCGDRDVHPACVAVSTPQTHHLSLAGTLCRLSSRQHTNSVQSVQPVLCQIPQCHEGLSPERSSRRDTDRHAT